MSFSPIKSRFNDSCPVCYNELTDEDTTFKNCKHGICRNCYSQLRTDNCPLCREPIPQKTECLLPPSSPISFWMRRHPRQRRRRRRWDNRRNEPEEEDRFAGRTALRGGARQAVAGQRQEEEETETKEHVEDRRQQKRRAKFPNGKKRGSRGWMRKGNLRR